MNSTNASSYDPSKKIKLTIIPPRQLFVNISSDEDVTTTPSPTTTSSSPTPPNAPSKTTSTNQTSSSQENTSSSFHSKLQISPPSSHEPTSPHNLNPLLDNISDVPPRPLNPPRQFKSDSVDLVRSGLQEETNVRELYVAGLKVNQLNLNRVEEAGLLQCITSPNGPIRRIHQGRYGVSVPALTKDHKRNEDQYAVSRGLNTPYSRYGINIIFWKISNVVPTPRNPQYALNTAYPLPLDTAYPVLCPIQRIHPNRLIRLRMTKVIKGEFEKIKDIKVEDDSLACDSPLEVFNCEVSRLSKMDDDLFTYEVEIANIPCDLRVDDDSEHEADDMGFDPSDIAFTEWLGSKFFNYKTMDHYTMKALWIYWIRGDDEVELTDEEFSNNEDEIAELDSIDDTIVGNLPGTFIIENQLHYQDYEWYKALEDSELKDEALRNKAIIEGFIKDDDDESSYEQMRRWDIHTNYDDTYKTNHDDNEREELCEVHEPLDLVKEISTNIGGEFTNLEILKCWSLETSRGVQHKIR
ncbi:hypothetical protein Tco_0534439 [Tanacetum coccineum]